MTEFQHLPGGGDLTDALFIRDEVFTKEQGFTIPDEDEFDVRSDHVVIRVDGSPAATGRTYCEADSATFHIGRICVRKQFRSLRLGRAVMDELEKLARAKGAKTLVLGAQLHAVPFYAKCGFLPTGERFFEEFCEHETMTKAV